MIRLFALLPFLPAVLMTAVFLVATAMNAEFVADYATGRLLWVPVTFALYYAVFLFVCWLFGWPLKLAMGTLLITPGVLFLHLVPGINQPGDRIGEIAWSVLAEWIVHYPGMEVWGPMHDYVQRNQYERSIHPDTLLDELTTAHRVGVRALAWHEDQVWMVVEADHKQRLVLVDENGSLSSDAHWAQGFHLRNEVSRLYSSERGLLVEGIPYVSRLQESGFERLGEWKDLTPISDGFFALGFRSGREGDWLIRLDEAGNVTQTWPSSDLRTRLGVAEDGFAAMGLIGAYEQGVICTYRTFQGDEDAGRGLLLFDGKQGWTLLPDHQADTAWKLGENHLMVLRSGDLRTVPLDGSPQTPTEVSDVLRVIGPLDEGLLLRRRSGFEWVSADLSESRPWPVPTKTWVTPEGPLLTQKSWTKTPDGPVFAVSPHPATHWARDAEGLIVPVWRVGADGHFDSTYNPRFAP